MSSNFVKLQACETVSNNPRKKKFLSTASKTLKRLKETQKRLKARIREFEFINN